METMNIHWVSIPNWCWLLGNLIYESPPLLKDSYWNTMHIYEYVGMCILHSLFRFLSFVLLSFLPSVLLSFFPFFIVAHLIYNIVLVSAICQIDSVIYFFRFFPLQVITRYWIWFLCYTVNSCCLSVLCIIVCIC